MSSLLEYAKAQAKPKCRVCCITDEHLQELHAARNSDPVIVTFGVIETWLRAKDYTGISEDMVRGHFRRNHGR
jgi:hypothetical protein